MNVTIQNMNPAYGWPIRFSGETLEDAVEAMESAIRQCGDEFASVTVTQADYIVIHPPQETDR